MALERLQKIIAAAGIASRRKAEELIQQGLVSVNGETVTELGTKADPETDSIRVNDKLLKGAERHEYIALNKPRGYVTTVADPEGRPTVMELVRSKSRIYPVGRLDFNSEGLLLLTNDGDLAHKLMKAASHIPKTYLVKVAGQPEEEKLRRLRAGVTIAEERNPSRRVRTAPAQIRIIKDAENPWLEVTLHEGRNRQIRKMFEEVGHHVEKIRRVRYGSLELDLPPGESRMLSPKEVAQLQRATQPQAQPRFKPRDGDSQFRKTRAGGPRRFERQPDPERPRPQKRQWKENRFSPRTGQSDRITAERRFDRRHSTDRPRPEKRESKENRFNPRSGQADRSTPNLRFERREDRRRPSRRSTEFGAPPDAKKSSSKPFSRAGRPAGPRGEFRGRRRPESDGRSNQGEPSSRSSRPTGHPNRSDRGKQRSGRRGPSRFSGK